MRRASGCAASARTRFCPSQPAAPVTTTVGGAARGHGRGRDAGDLPLVVAHGCRRYRFAPRRSGPVPGSRLSSLSRLRRGRSPSFPLCPEPTPKPTRRRARVAVVSHSAEGRRNAIALTVVALVFAMPLRGLLRSPGPPMEEGFMLVFPEQVLKGAIPNRDFLHLYGPGSLWALAGVFKVFGVSLWSERGFGLAAAARDRLRRSTRWRAAGAASSRSRPRSPRASSSSRSA